MLFDTHTHIDSHKFNDDRAEMLARARSAGVELMMLISTSEAGSRRALALAETLDGVYVAIGVHPSDAADWDEAMYRRFLGLAKHPKVKAIGEIGLDYHWDYPRDAQFRAFRDQVRLAREVGLPIVIHDREAHADVVRVLEEEGAREVGGVMHSFSGDWPLAERCLDLQFYIGLSGPVTYPRNAELREVARRTPLDRILIETDCPYLPPQPQRGKRNEPAYVRYVAECLAEVRASTYQEIAHTTSENGKRLFRIP